MNINGRLLLLAVVAGLFIRIWSGGDHTRNRHLVARQQRPALVRTVSVLRNAPGITTETVGLGVDAPIVAESPSVDSLGTVEKAESWTEEAAPIAIPADLVPGTWRIVDDSGRVARITLTREAVASNAGTESQFQVTLINGRRWYFIRIQNAATVSPTPELVPDRPIVADPVISSVNFPETEILPSTTQQSAETGNQPEPPQPVESQQEVVVDLEPQVVVTPVRELTAEELAEREASQEDIRYAAESAAEPAPEGEAVLTSVDELEASIRMSAEVGIGSIEDTAESAAPVAERANEALAAESDEASAPTAGNRKFDFSGYGVEAAIAVDSDRPLPPALPINE